MDTERNSFKPVCIDWTLNNGKVSDFISPLGDWDITKLRNNVVLSNDVEIIRRIPINEHLDDKIIWHFDKAGKYTVKSGYKVFMNSKIDGVSSNFDSMTRVWNKLWKLSIPTKIKHFYWKAIKNTLPTRLNLLNRGIDTTSSCPICSNHFESTYHILFECQRAKEIWKLTFDRVFLETNFNDNFLDRWMKICSSLLSRELGLVVVVCWSIWNDRNKAIHDDVIPPITLKISRGRT